MALRSRLQLVLLILFAFSLLGCSEEKAKALQLAAETFRSEADTACAMGASSILASFSMPARTQDEVTKSLVEATRFGPAELEAIYSDNSIVAAGLEPVQDALDKVCAAHRRLAAIYTDLPKGYLLATDDVKAAQRHVVNVTVRFARLSKAFESLPSIGRNNAARIKIIEARAKAMAVTDEKARVALLRSVAETVLANQTSEIQNKAQVIAQFAKAVALGEKLARASVEYDKLSVSDLLDSLREFSSLYGGISGRTALAQNAIQQVNAIEAKIKTDPILSTLLDADLAR